MNYRYDIKENSKNGGFYAIFACRGKYYLADIAYTFDAGPECMIFESDADGNIEDWTDAYVEHFDEVTKKNLVTAIEDFCDNMEEEQDGQIPHA